MDTIITSETLIAYLNKTSYHPKAMYATGRPSVQAYYGPYDSLLTAHKAVCMAYGDFDSIDGITAETGCEDIPRGLTVAVANGDKIEEYQYQAVTSEGGYTGSDLKKKASAPEALTAKPTDLSEYDEGSILFVNGETAADNGVYAVVEVDGVKSMVRINDDTLTACENAATNATKAKSALDSISGFQAKTWEALVAEYGENLLVVENEFVIHKDGDGEYYLYRCTNQQKGTTFGYENFTKTSLAEVCLSQAVDDGNEHLNIHISASKFITDESGVKTEEAVSVEGQKVSISNTTTGDVIFQDLTLDSNGNIADAVDVKVPYGTNYSISVTNPDPENCMNLPISTFKAKQSSRTISLSFRPADTGVETVIITAIVYDAAKNRLTGDNFPTAFYDTESNLGTLDINISYTKDGTTTTVKVEPSSTGKDKYVAQIPYGCNYTITPDLSQGNYDCLYQKTVERQSCVPTRNIPLEYVVKASDDVCLVLIDENNVLSYDHSSLDEIAQWDSDKKAQAKYVYVGTSNPSSTTAGLGENAFLIPVSGGNLGNKAWGTGSMATAEVPTNSLPFLTNASQTGNASYYTGKANTQFIIDTCAEREDATCPAATACHDKSFIYKLSDSGAEYTAQGFLPSYGQLASILAAYSTIEGLLTALGQTMYTLKSGNWWSSCQFSATNAVNLYDGSFDSIFIKSYLFNVLVCYDL